MYIVYTIYYNNIIYILLENYRVQHSIAKYSAFYFDTTIDKKSNYIVNKYKNI